MMRIPPTFRFLIIGMALALPALIFQPASGDEADPQAHCIDTQDYGTWRAVLAEIRRFYHSPGPVDTLTVRLTHGKNHILEIDASQPFSGRGRQFYIHCCNEGFLWCEIASPLPYIIDNREQSASFFRSNKVQISKWSELQTITDTLKQAGACCISISAEEDFRIAEKAAGLLELFSLTPNRKAPAIFLSYVFICPDSPTALPEWMQDTFHDSPPFRQAMQKLTDGSMTGSPFIHELIRLGHEHPRALAHFLLTSKSIYPDLIRHNRTTE